MPKDVGLITVDSRGCSVVKPSPIRKEVELDLSAFQLNDLIRWVSVRGDRRHAEVNG